MHPHAQIAESMHLVQKKRYSHTPADEEKAPEAETEPKNQTSMC